MLGYPRLTGPQEEVGARGHEGDVGGHLHACVVGGARMGGGNGVSSVNSAKHTVRAVWAVLAVRASVGGVVHEGGVGGHLQAWWAGARVGGRVGGAQKVGRCTCEHRVDRGQSQGTMMEEV
jgi:hypothetical protein